MNPSVLLLLRNVHTHPAFTHIQITTSVECEMFLFASHILSVWSFTTEQIPEKAVKLSVCVCVCLLPHVSDTRLAQQLRQGGPATLGDLQRVPDDAEEVGQETKAHLQQKKNTLRVTSQQNGRTLTPQSQSAAHRQACR